MLSNSLVISTNYLLVIRQTGTKIIGHEQIEAVNHGLDNETIKYILTLIHVYVKFDLLYSRGLRKDQQHNIEIKSSADHDQTCRSGIIELVGARYRHRGQFFITRVA